MLLMGLLLFSIGGGAGDHRLAALGRRLHSERQPAGVLCAVQAIHRQPRLSVAALSFRQELRSGASSAPAVHPFQIPPP